MHDANGKKTTNQPTKEDLAIVIIGPGQIIDSKK